MSQVEENGVLHREHHSEVQRESPLESQKRSQDQNRQEVPEVHHPQKKENGSAQKTEVKLCIEESKLYEKKVSIFSSRKENQKVLDIFANKKSVNLLKQPQSNSQAQGINIFKMPSSSQPSVRNHEDEQELNSLSSASVADSQIESAPPEPTEKIMKFDYEQRTIKMGEFKLVKFKNGVNPARENLVLSLQKSKDGANQPLYFILRNEATKIKVYEAFFLNNTQMEHFMEREENWKLKVIRYKKDKEDKAKTELEIVKLQFESAEQAKEFEKIVLEWQAKSE